MKSQVMQKDFDTSKEYYSDYRKLRRENRINEISRMTGLEGDWLKYMTVGNLNNSTWKFTTDKELLGLFRHIQSLPKIQ